MAIENARKALLIGNDNYEFVGKLKGAIKDMRSMEKLLINNEDGSINFTVSSHPNLSNYRIREEIQKFLNTARTSNVGLIYFAGHGVVKADTGYICGINVQEGNPGVSMKWLIDEVNRSGMQDVTLILDCCHAGAILDMPTPKYDDVHNGKNISVLAATTKNDVAGEFRCRGVFSSILETGLSGAAADIKGAITASGLHNYASDQLTVFQQQPVFKLTTGVVIPIRKCLPIPKNVLIGKLIDTDFFRSEDHVFVPENGMSCEKGPELDKYLALSFFEQLGFLSLPDHKTLAEVIDAGESFALSSLGQQMWEQITNAKKS
jgi:hypothetical protein